MQRQKTDPKLSDAETEPLGKIKDIIVCSQLHLLHCLSDLTAPLLRLVIYSLC